MVDVELYGGKRGFLDHSRARVLYALGIYGNIRNINWAAVSRLAFVCAGNICRSPYASTKARLLGVPAVSFGLTAKEGAAADPVASRNALPRGVDLSTHRSARVKESSFHSGDLVVVFEPWHLAAISQWLRPGLRACLAGVWTRPIRPHIQDPYGRSDKYFQQCFAVIDANIAAIIGNMADHGLSQSKERIGDSAAELDQRLFR